MKKKTSLSSKNHKKQLKSISKDYYDAEREKEGDEAIFLENFEFFCCICVSKFAFLTNKIILKSNSYLQFGP